MSEKIVLTDGVNLKAYQDEVTRLHAVIGERDREIERLRAWLESIEAITEDQDGQAAWAAVSTAPKLRARTEGGEG